MQRIDVHSRGLRLNLDVLEGAAGDPAILFLHGTGKYARFYQPFLKRLRAAGFTVLGLDLQGHGCSEGRRGDFTIEELVTNTRDVLTYALREIGPAVGLLGSSQGAIIVLYTLAADERAMSAVCHNAALLDEPGSRRVNVSRFSRLMRPLVGPASRLLPGLRLPIRRYLRIETVWEDLALGRKLEADPLVVKSYTLRSFASLASARPARPIEWVSTPTLFLAAEHDRLFPTSYVRSIFDRLRCRKAMVVVPDTTHMLFVEYLEQSLPPVVEWFKRTLGSGGSS